jgi:cyclohexa-1,5-dienecarbonyl-CoA hydratase
MEFQHVRLDVQEKTATLTLCRPPLNIMNMALMEELVKALDSLKDQKHLRALVIRAEGKVFCAGAAVEDHVGETTVPFIKLFHQVFRSMLQVPCPTVAVVEGAALGGGLELVTFCDLVVASENAKFGQPEINLAVFAPVSAVTFPGLMSHNRMMELMLTGEPISARQAYEWGLVNRLAPPDQVEEQLNALLAQLGSKSASALRATRLAVQAAAAQSFEEAIERVEKIYLDHIFSKDAQEGLYAFLEKRQPVWKDE